MPFSLNGCGTKYYGSRDVAEDGSYITTLWITFVWVPIIPLASYRILPTGKGFNAGIVANQSYVGRREPFQWRQVGNVYLFALPFLVMLGYFSYGDIVSERHKKATNPVPIKSYSPVDPTAPQPEEAPVVDPQKACGAKIKLDEKGMRRLSVRDKMLAIVGEVGVTDEDKTNTGAGDDDAFEGYALGYLSWQKPREEMQTAIDDSIKKETVKADLDANNESEAYKAAMRDFMLKEKLLINRGFQQGRSDARQSPCRY